MKIPNRYVDIEVTNRCNATCDFCPREATPKQGFMSEESFQQVLKRILEVDRPENITLSLTGRGEPTLHPKLLYFVEELTRQGFAAAITTNGSRLTPTLSQQLLDAGLKRIHLSVSDLGDNYNKVYGLKFNDVLQRIENFIALAKGRCFIQVTVVQHAGNADTIDHVVTFWESRNVDNVLVMKEENRSGLVQTEFRYNENLGNKQKAIRLLHERGLTDICSSPFYAVFFGWEGRYNLCCQDWEKTVDLGSVFDYSIEEIDDKKLEFVQHHYGVCENCSVNPVNDLKRVLDEIDEGKRGKFAIANKINSIASGRQNQKELRNILDAMGFQSRVIAKSS